MWEEDEGGWEVVQCRDEGEGQEAWRGEFQVDSVSCGVKEEVEWEMLSLE